MSSFALCIYALIGAVIAHACGAAWAIEQFLDRKQAQGRQRIWFALACASLILVLNYGYALERALHTGLFDLRQATLGSLAGMLLAGAIYGLRRQPV